MQAHSWTSTPSGNDVPRSLETYGAYGAIQPATTQNGYYNGHQRTLNQQNNNQSLCLSNTYINSSTQPSSSSPNLQSSQTLNEWFTSLNSNFYANSASFRPSCPNVTVHNTPLPFGQLGTQAENLSHHPQLSYSNSSLHLPNKNIPTIQTSTADWFPSVSSNGRPTVKDNNLMHGSNPLVHQSLNAKCNVIQTTCQHRQQTAPSVQSRRVTQTFNPSRGQIRTVGNGASYRCSAQSSSAIQGHTTPSVPPHYRTQKGTFSLSRGQSQSMLDQVQNSSPVYSQPVLFNNQSSHVGPNQTIYTANNGPSKSFILPLPTSYQTQHNVVQSQSKHRMDKNSLSLSQDKVPSEVRLHGDLLEQMKSSQTFQDHNTISVVGHRSKIVLPTFPADQCNKRPRVHQSNHMTNGLTRTSQDASITPTAKAPLPTHSGPGNWFQVTLKDLLLSKDDGQAPEQRHDINPLWSSSNRFLSQVSGSRGEHQQTAHEQTAGQSVASSQMQTSTSHYGIPATPSYGEMQKINEHQACFKAMGVLTGHNHGHGSQLKAPDVETRCERAPVSRFQMYSQIKKSNGQMSKGRREKVQYCVDPADCLEVVMALHKVARLTNRAVAVVPPISQKATNPKENVTSSTDDCQSLKINAVWSLAKEEDDIGMKLKSQSQPTEVTEDQFKEYSVSLLEMQESVKPGQGYTTDNQSCEVILSENDTTLGSQSVDIPQCENVPVSAYQCSNMPQNPTEDPVCSPDVALKCPQEQHDDTNIESYLNDSFDLTKAPLVDYTLEKCKNLVKALELEQAEGEKVKETTDVTMCILDLFWNGEEKKLQEQLKEGLATGLLMTSFEAGVKENHAVVFQYLDLEILKSSNQYHILDNETTLPTEEFRSSPSYSNKQPADIESVLAESIADYDLTWYKDIYSTIICSLGNHEDCLVQVNAENSEILSESDTTSENISEVSRSDPNLEVFIPAVTDCQNNIMTLNKALSNLPVCEGKSPSEASKKQDLSEQQKPNEQLHGRENNIVHLTDSAETPCILTESNNGSQPDKEHTNIDNDSQSSSGTLKSKHDLIEQQDEHAHAELSISTSLASSSDQHVKNDGNVKDPCERGETSNDASSFCDSMSMEVTLLSSDDAKEIFKECSYYDNLRESAQSCQGDQKDSATMSSSEPDHVTSKGSHGTPNHIRFTCPHVINVVSDDDHFCPKCWAETPVLDVHLDEDVFIPKEGEPHITTVPSKPDNQNSSPQSDKPVKEPVAPVCSESGSIAKSDILTPKCDGSDIMMDCPKRDEIQNCNLECDESFQPKCFPSRSIAMPVLNKLCDVTVSCRPDSPKGLSDIENVVMSDQIIPKYDGSDIITAHPKPDEGESCNSMSDEHLAQESLQPVRSLGVLTTSLRPKSCNTLSDIENIENVNPVSPPHTKTLTHKVSPPRNRPHKKLKFKRTSIMPADDLFAPDIIVVKKTKRSNIQRQRTSSQRKEHPTQTELGACRMNQKEQAQCKVPNVCNTSQSLQCNAVPQEKKNKEKVISLALYGPQSSNSDVAFVHRCHDPDKFHAAPPYITVSSSPPATKTNTCMPTARQKVYSDWSSTFVKIKKTSHKKCHKRLKNDLMS